MSKNTVTDHNATPLDDDTGLRGGTQGGRSAPLLPANDMPSSATNGLPTGTNTRRQGMARNPDDATDAVAGASGDSTRHPSQSEAKRAAREAADVPADLSRDAFNEGDKANQHRTDTSDGNHASTSGKKFFDAPEDADDLK